MATVPGLAQLSNQSGGGGSANFVLVQKTSDEIRNNTATLAVDGALFFAMSASTTYVFRMVVYFTGDSTPDFKFGHDGPAGSVLIDIHHRFTAPGGTSFTGVGVLNAYNPSTGVAITATTGGNSVLFLDGTIQNGATPGNFEFRWSQNTSNAGNSIVRAGSFIEYRAV